MAFAMVLICACSLSAQAPKITEYQVKAAYLANGYRPPSARPLQAHALVSEEEDSEVFRALESRLEKYGARTVPIPKPPAGSVFTPSEGLRRINSGWTFGFTGEVKT